MGELFSSCSLKTHTEPGDWFAGIAKKPEDSISTDINSSSERLNRSLDAANWAENTAAELNNSPHTNRLIVLSCLFIHGPKICVIESFPKCMIKS